MLVRRLDFFFEEKQDWKAVSVHDHVFSSSNMIKKVSIPIRYELTTFKCNVLIKYYSMLLQIWIGMGSESTWI